uniref:Uncharacterized protein n=1 Tax=Rhizophora mucronata TaxID=61149 RepID=A0A2P2NYK0_RHIMU
MGTGSLVQSHPRLED